MIAFLGPFPFYPFFPRSSLLEHSHLSPPSLSLKVISFFYFFLSSRLVIRFRGILFHLLLSRQCVASYALSASNKYTQTFPAQLVNFFSLFSVISILVVQYTMCLYVFIFLILTSIVNRYDTPTDSRS